MTAIRWRLEAAGVAPCTGTGELWSPALQPREAIQTYSVVRWGIAMAKGAEQGLPAIDEKAPTIERSASHD